MQTLFLLFIFIFVISCSKFWGSERMFSPDPLNSNVRVNRPGRISDNEADVSLGLDGRYMIVWNRDNCDITGQLYNSDGVKVSPNNALKSSAEFKINDEECGECPCVNFGPFNMFVVVWRTNKTRVNGKLYYHFGINYESVPLEEVINPPSDLRVSDPFVSVFRNGSFIIVWADSSGLIYGQMFNSSGSKQGENFQINDLKTLCHREQLHISAPKVKVSHGGGFIVVWQSDSETSIGKSYDQNFQGTLFTIAENATCAHLAVGHNGDFGVAWYQFEKDHSNIFVQRFDRGGKKLHNESIRVNTEELNIRDHCSFSINGNINEGFIVVWGNSFKQKTDVFYDVYGQRFDGTGAKFGKEFKIT